MPAKPAQEAEWYAEGLRFECTCCGACCTGAPGYVRFTEEEAAAIARRLGTSKAAFYREFAKKVKIDGRERWSLAERKTEHGYDCVFLDRASLRGKAVCSLYEDRPLQCRTFPFWPENIRAPRDWQRTGRSCEGVGRGTLIPVEQIRIQRDKHP